MDVILKVLVFSMFIRKLQYILGMNLKELKGFYRKCLPNKIDPRLVPGT